MLVTYSWLTGHLFMCWEDLPGPHVKLKWRKTRELAVALCLFLTYTHINRQSLINFRRLSIIFLQIIGWSLNHADPSGPPQIKKINTRNKKNWTKPLVAAHHEKDRFQSLSLGKLLKNKPTTLIKIKQNPKLLNFNKNIQFSTKSY